METHPDWTPEFGRQYFEGREITVYGRNAPAFDGTTTHRQDFVQHHFEPRPQGQRQFQGK